jgi:hypothetical protein
MDKMDKKYAELKQGMWIGFILGMFATTLLTQIVLYIKEVL